MEEGLSCLEKRVTFFDRNEWTDFEDFEDIGNRLKSLETKLLQEKNTLSRIYLLS